MDSGERIVVFVAAVLFVVVLDGEVEPYVPPAWA
jgi:hypothetical protein